MSLWVGSILSRLPSQCWLCAQPERTGLGLCHYCQECLPWLGTSVCRLCACTLAAPGVCGACLRRVATPVASTQAALRFEGLARELVHAFKFRHDLVAGRILARCLSMLVSTHINVTLAPIPSTPSRRLERGFDPACEICRFLGRATGQPVAMGLLRRRGNRAPQSSLLSRRHREVNSHGMFHVKRVATRPTSIILIDDVLTTGATSRAAAVALQQCGYSVEALWACTRTV